VTREPLPARRLLIPGGFVITNEEVTRAIEALNGRVARGEVGFDVAQETPEWYALKVPVGTSLTREEIMIVLELADRAKAHGHADLLLTFSDGRLVKKWTTLKDAQAGAGFSTPAPAIGGIRIRSDF
jgi:hypothetical protein